MKERLSVVAMDTDWRLNNFKEEFVVVIEDLGTICMLDGIGKIRSNCLACQ